MSRPEKAPEPAALLDHARAAAQLAYAPYSRFPVGAALLTAGGRIVTGCNVENAAYGLAICAERNAAAAMVATDPADRRIVAVAIVGLEVAPCFPCGACRQVLHEFGCAQVIVESPTGSQTYPFEQILPHGFGPDALPGTAR